MKFDYCIGNPPYQEESENKSKTNGQAPRKNIFHFFQLQADEVARTSSVHNFRQLDALTYAQNGTLQEKLDELFDK